MKMNEKNGEIEKTKVCLYVYFNILLHTFSGGSEGLVKLSFLK